MVGVAFAVDRKKLLEVIKVFFSNNTNLCKVALDCQIPSLDVLVYFVNRKITCYR